MYYCKFDNYQRTSIGTDDFAEYRFNFMLIPEEKIGQPNEKHHEKELSIFIKCSRSQAATWGLNRDHPELVKIMYWLGKERIREGRVTIGADNEYTWREFPDEFKNLPPDATRIDYPPKAGEGFLTQIRSGNSIGFHQ